MASKAYLHRRIRELQRDVDAIEKSFFAPYDASLDAKYWALARKKENLIRLVVIELHLSIEDLITDAIIGHLSPSRRPRPATAAMLTTPDLYELLQGAQAIRFPAKLALARTLKIITSPEVKRLQVLNTLRNRCSHHWTLNVVRRRNIKPKNPKKPVLAYEGKSLYVAANLDRFVGEFAAIYLRLWRKFP